MEQDYEYSCQLPINFLTEMKEEKVKRKKDCDGGERLIYKFLLVVKRREETEWC